MEESETVRRGSAAEYSFAASGKDKAITMIEMTGYRYDANDDMAPVMDAVLKRLSFGVTYGKDDENEWKYDVLE